MKDDPKEKLRSLLRQLFQFENQDLEFGIYRIINHNKEKLKNFIQRDLAAVVEKQLNSSLAQRDFGDMNSGAVEGEIYTHLIRFFSRYYQEGEFIAQRRYGKEQKYVIPFSGEEMNFYWVNKEQYYVKSSEFFNKYSFKVRDLRIDLRLLNADMEKGNLKASQKKFFLLSSPAYQHSEGQLALFFDYRSLTEEEKHLFGRSAKQAQVNDSILNTLLLVFESLPEIKERFENPKFMSTLRDHLSRFTRKQNRDYFIHKDLENFLKSELDFYLKNEVVGFENLSRWDESELAIVLLKARVIQTAAKKIIERLAQLEDFQKKLWNKKSFVLNSDYVITLDKIRQLAGEAFLKQIIPEVLTNRQQLKDWQINFNFKPTEEDTLSDLFPLTEKRWQKLPVDTAYFDGIFKWKLLNALGRDNNLDDLLDGILIHSENWHGLHLLQKKFAGRIRTVYIDPPFNKGQEADYFYKVGYKDSTWNTLLENRINAAKPLICDDGCIFVRCDYNGSMYVRLLLNEIFGRDNFRNEIIINRTLAKQKVQKQFAVQTDSLFLFAKSGEFTPQVIERPTHAKWYPLLHFPRKDERPRTVLGKVFYPPKNRRWALSQEKIDSFAARGKIRINENLRYKDFRGEEIIGTPELLYDSELVGNEWLDIPGYAQRHRFPTENAEALLKRVIESTSRPGDWVMDFFLGSGTAIAMAHKIGRKWIGIEMGEHFESVILPRMKKVLFGDKSGISKEAGWQGGGFFKYHSLEQFDDALENIRFSDAPRASGNANNAVVRYLLDYASEHSPTFLDITSLENPFNYRMRVFHSREEQEQRVDLVETFNYLLGLTVQRIEHAKANGNHYVFVLGETTGEKTVVVWRTSDNLDLESDRKFIEQTVAAFSPQRIYVNGDCALEGAMNIEQELRERMMGDV